MCYSKSVALCFVKVSLLFLYFQYTFFTVNFVQTNLDLRLVGKRSSFKENLSCKC